MPLFTAFMYAILLQNYTFSFTKYYFLSLCSPVPFFKIFFVATDAFFKYVFCSKSTIFLHWNIDKFLGKYTIPSRCKKFFFHSLVPVKYFSMFTIWQYVMIYLILARWWFSYLNQEIFSIWQILSTFYHPGFDSHLDHFIQILYDFCI